MSLNLETLPPNAMPHSYTSFVTHIAETEEVNVPKVKIELEEALGNLEIDWENDPDNARNWSFRRKWTTIAIVSTIFFAYLVNRCFFPITGVVLHVCVSTG